MQKILWLWLILSSNAFAQNLGQFGALFPIVEEDALLWLTQKRLPQLQADGSIEQLEKKLQNQAREQIKHPKGIQLPRTQQSKAWLLDLTVTAPRDFKDLHGRVVVAKGTRANPLDIVPMSQKQMLFVDGNDVKQMDWAKRQWFKNPMETRIVLINGAIEDLTQQYDLRLYFDQHGKLIEHFGIQQVPASVKRFSNQLLIEEIAI